MRSGLTDSNVIATITVFVALGGASYVGGGVDMVQGTAKGVAWLRPRGFPEPSGQREPPTGWMASWINESGSTDLFKVYVVCASP